MKLSQTPLASFWNRAKVAALVAGAALTTVGVTQTSVQAQTPGKIGSKAPALREGTWSVGKPTTLASLKGKVVLLSFWTTRCINCQRTVPYWAGWAKQATGSHDFAVVTVHTPEFSNEKPVKVSHDYATSHGLNVPVLVDNDRKNWDAFNIEFWPTTILIDKNGIVRGRWEGELNWQGSGDYKKVEAAIALLRKEK
jgi:thiol-disulfide isomerase/thioredoxin